jgi:hypothetical protein
MKQRLIFSCLISCTAVLFCVFISSCSKNDTGNSGGYPKTVSIEYKLTATGGAMAVITSMSYTNETSGTTNLDSMPMPFSRTIRATVKQGDPITLYARHIAREPNTFYGIKMDILVDGTLVATKTEQATGTVIGGVTHVFR